MIADNISNYLCNTGAHNIDNDSIIEILKEMQSKGLIHNKLYWPMEANNTTSKSPQSTSWQSKTTPAEENHFIKINDFINKSLPPSRNRSLPGTPIVEPNTPRVYYLLVILPWMLGSKLMKWNVVKLWKWSDTLWRSFDL